jgi:hypothetical protein
VAIPLLGAAVKEAKVRMLINEQTLPNIMSKMAVMN